MENNVQSYFEKNAISFDSLYKEGSVWERQYNKIVRSGVYKRVELTINLIHQMGNPSVLDVGSGSGRNSILFCDCGASEVKGLDFSKPMLELAERCVSERGLQNRISFEQGDFFTWSKNQKWDLVVALGFLDYFPDPAIPLRRMKQYANKKVCFSIRRPTLVRMPVRKFRYWLKSCPIYFFGKARILSACSEFSEVQIMDGGSGSYFVIASV